VLPSTAPPRAPPPRAAARRALGPAVRGCVLVQKSWWARRGSVAASACVRASRDLAARRRATHARNGRADAGTIFVKAKGLTIEVTTTHVIIDY